MVEPPCSEPSLPRDVRVGGPDDTGGRDAALVEEVPVLGGEHRIDHRLRDLVTRQHLPVGGAEPADEAAVLGVDHGLRVPGGRHRRRGHRRLLVGDHHRDRAEHDDAADDGEQDAHGLAQRPVPPPAALDLDRGAVETAPSRSGQTPGAPRPSRPARTSRGAQAGAAQARATRAARAAAVAPAPARAGSSGVSKLPVASLSQFSCVDSVGSSTRAWLPSRWPLGARP